MSSVTNSSDATNLSNVTHIVRHDRPHCVPTQNILVRVGNLTIQAFFDTGAQVSLIREDVLQRIEADQTPFVSQPTKNLVTVLGDPMPNIGTALIP